MAARDWIPPHVVRAVSAREIWRGQTWHWAPGKVADMTVRWAGLFDEIRRH